MILLSLPPFAKMALWHWPGNPVRSGRDEFSSKSFLRPRSPNRKRFEFLAGDHLGGFHIDGAYANGINYAPGNDWFDPFSGNPPIGGHLFAINAEGTATLWKVDLAAPVIAGAAVADGVVYLQSIDGQFYGFDAQTGEELIR